MLCYMFVIFSNIRGAIVALRDDTRLWNYGLYSLSPSAICFVLRVLHYLASIRHHSGEVILSGFIVFLLYLDTRHLLRKDNSQLIEENQFFYSRLIG